MRNTSDPAVRAIARIRNIRDLAEMVGRPPGEILAISRQDLESILDDTGVIARLIRELAERVP